MAAHSSFQRRHYQDLESVEVFEFSQDDDRVQDDGGAVILSISRNNTSSKKTMIYKVHIKCQEITSNCS